MIATHKTLYSFEHDQYENIDGLALTSEEPRMDPGNPVLTGGPSEAPFDGKICYTSSLERAGAGYGLWYQREYPQGNFVREVAFSADGFEWHKETITGDQLFEELGNSFNVYWDGQRYLAPLTALGTEVSAESEYRALLPEDPPDERRRALAQEAIEKTGRAGVVTFVGVATSHDGKVWSLPQPTPRLPMKLETPWIYRFQGRYIMNAQTNGKWFDPPHPSSRIVTFFTSEDLLSWETIPECMTNRAHESILGQTHVGILPIKQVDDRMLLGLGGRFDDGAELTDQHFEITLLHSYDGLHWSPVVPDHERRNWIRRGRRGEWDFGGVAGIGMIENGDRAAVYFNGTSIGNACHTQPTYDPGSCQVGRALLLRDRFAALQPIVGWKTLDARAAGTTVRGTLTTVPLTISKDRSLSLNVDIPRDDAATVTVEALRPDGSVIATGTLNTGGVSAEVPISEPIAGESVRLRITLIGGPAPDLVPRLFAIEY
jgi:hypothetical protein